MPVERRPFEFLRVERFEITLNFRTMSPWNVLVARRDTRRKRLLQRIVGVFDYL